MKDSVLLGNPAPCNSVISNNFMISSNKCKKSRKCIKLIFDDRLLKIQRNIVNVLGPSVLLSPGQSRGGVLLGWVMVGCKG